MKKRIFACISALAVAAMASVNAFAYTVKPNKQSNEIVLVGENGIYSSASELSGLTEIKLTASTDHDPSALSGSFKVVCDDAAQTFKWTAESGDNVVFKINDDSMYEAVVESVEIPEKCTEIKLVFENDNEKTLDLVGVELVGIDEPKKPEIATPSSSDVVSEEPSSVEKSEIESSSEPKSSSEITASSSQTETSSDSVKDENDSSNKPTGVGTGLALASIAIAAAAVVSLKKSK